MRVVFRADASSAIGSGHVMRCLTLADQLRDRAQAQVEFVCRKLPGHWIDYIRARGYPVAALSAADLLQADDAADAHMTIAHLTGHARQTADWLVVDHYGLDKRYERRVRPYVKRLMVIDDLADRPHCCDMLLDPNVDPEQGARYRDLIEPATKLVIGAQYAPLRPEFAAFRSRVKRDGGVRRLLVSFGGVDATGEIGKTLAALAPLAGLDLHIVVLAGKANPARSRLAGLCAELPHVAFLAHSEHMAEQMLAADLAIGAGGSTMWERCCLGLPALVITTADNQEHLTAMAAKTGAVRWLGRSAEVDAGMIREAVVQAIRDGEGLRRMSARAMQLTDGQGAIRIVKEMCS